MPTYAYMIYLPTEDARHSMIPNYVGSILKDL
jgi:hypothetical protein